MKKIFKMMMAVVAGFAALTACTNEPEEGVTPTPEAQGFTVIASMDDAAKAIFTDGEGLNWSVGDKIGAIYQKLNDKGEIVSAYEESAQLNNETIADGTTGTFSFNTVPTGDVYFSLNHNANAYTKHEYLFKNEITQPAAGGINPSLIKLLGDKVTLNGTEESVTVKMNLVGTMMRFLVYSSTGEYADENILSVKLVGNEKFSGNNAVIGINHKLGGYLQENNENNVGENAVIFYGCNNDYINVTLTVPASLNATNAEGCIGKGIYMPVAPISLSGYKYIVTTDAHQFTFDASTKPVSFANNTVKNVLLDVEKATSVEIYDNNNKGILAWEETLPENVTLGASAVTDQNIGTSYIYVKTQDNGSSDWVKRDKNDANAVYYEGITFETSEDWLTVGYAENNDNILVSAEANTATEERTATLTVTFADANGYLVDDANNSFTVTFTQAAAGSAKEIKVNASYGLPRNFTLSHQSLQDVRVSEVVDENVSAAIGNCYLVFEVDGVKLEGDKFWGKEETNTVYKSVDFFCHQTLSAAAERADWISIQYPTDTNGNINDVWPRITVQANTTGVQRQSLVRVLLTVPEGYIFKGKEAGETELVYGQFEITQQAYTPEMTATLSNVLTEAVSKDGAEGVAVATVAISADGTPVADLSAYKSLVTIGGGARNMAVAADGTITADIPANSTTEAKTYTITVKDTKGNTLATAEFTQEAGDGSGEVVEGPLVTDWTLRIIHGAKYVGFGSQVLNAGDGYGISSVTIDGKVYNSAALLAELTSEQLQAVIDTIFEIQEYESSELEVPSAPIYSVEEQKEMFVLEPRVAGAEICVALVFQNTNQTGKFRYVKVCCNKADGSQDVKYYFQTQ